MGNLGWNDGEGKHPKVWENLRFPSMKTFFYNVGAEIFPGQNDFERLMARYLGATANTNTVFF